MLCASVMCASSTTAVEPAMEGDLEDGHEVQAPEVHPPEQVDVQDLEARCDVEPPALRRSTRIRQPPGWYGDRIILPA